MRRLTAIAIGVLAAGIGLLGYSVGRGESEFHLVLIFPVLTGSGLFGFAGVLLLIAGMFLGFASFAGIPWRFPPAPSAPSPAPTPPTGPGAPPKRFGGLVFVGPIPIVFGSDPQVSKAMLAVAVAVTIILIVFFALTLIS